MLVHDDRYFLGGDGIGRRCHGRLCWPRRRRRWVVHGGCSAILRSAVYEQTSSRGVPTTRNLKLFDGGMIREERERAKLRRLALWVALSGCCRPPKFLNHNNACPHEPRRFTRQSIPSIYVSTSLVMASLDESRDDCRRYPQCFVGSFIFTFLLMESILIEPGKFD